MNSYHNPCQKAQVRYGESLNMPGRVSMPEQSCMAEKPCQMDHPCFTDMKEEWPLGMTYVPMQKWKEIYPLEEGFCYGTIFKELNLPFTGRRVC